jgi:lipopolysaccharide transport system permease protein
MLNIFTLNKNLLINLVRRDIAVRYKESVIGLFWSFINPILMLSVYSFVFSDVFKAKWSNESGEKSEYAVITFCGLIIFNFFAECLSRAPFLVIGNVNYVKKVVFPLELLSIVSACTALYHLLISLIVWVVFHSIFIGYPPATIAYVPLLLIPLLLMTIGLSWVVASAAVYLRDLSHLIGSFLGVLIFLTPIFYPISAVPESYKILIKLNVLAHLIEQMRSVMYYGNNINWSIWVVLMFVSTIIFLFGSWFFIKTKSGFSDVL